MTRRETAAKILEEVPQAPAGIRSDLEPQRFHDFTGIWHDDMKDSWRKNKQGPKLWTACGGFAGWYAGRMGIAISDVFELEKSLIDTNKQHAWVQASSGAKPRVGDILRHTIFHVDVAAGWKGTNNKVSNEWSAGARLIRVAAGQSSHPRPTTSVESEFDALKWVTGERAYDASKLQGWLDIDLFFEPAPVPGPSLAWLEGWWKVWDGSFYFYFFGTGGAVQYTKTQPANTRVAPKYPANRGRYSYDAANNKLVVTWNLPAGTTTAAVETFENAIPGCRQMNATSTLYSPLVATRLS